jgi:hypothetical protein
MGMASIGGGEAACDPLGLASIDSGAVDASCAGVAGQRSRCVPSSAWVLADAYERADCSVSSMIEAAAWRE